MAKFPDMTISQMLLGTFGLAVMIVCFWLLTLWVSYLKKKALETLKKMLEEKNK